VRDARKLTDLSTTTQYIDKEVTCALARHGVFAIINVCL